MNNVFRNGLLKCAMTLTQAFVLECSTQSRYFRGLYQSTLNTALLFKLLIFFNKKAIKNNER